MNNLLLTIFSLFLLACGGGSSEGTNDTLTSEQETQIADSLSSQVQEVGETLKEEADQVSRSVDELLDGI